MKVGKKISAGYIVILVFMFLSCACGLFLIAKMNDISDTTKNTYMKLYEKTNTVAKNSGLKVAALRGYVITGEDNYIKDFYQLDKESDALLKELEEQSTTEEGRKYARDLRAVSDHYQGIVEKKLVPAKKANQADEINQIIKSELAPAAEDSKKIMAEYIAFRHQQIESVLQNSIDNGSTAKMILIGFTVVSMVASILIAFFLIRSIVGPLQAAVGYLTKVAGGDFSMKVSQEFLAFQDEIGDLARATHTMVGNISSILKTVITSSQTMAASSEELTANAEQSALASVHVAESITTVSSNAEEQTVSANEAERVVLSMAEAMETGSTQAKNVAELSNKTFASAQSGAEIVNQAISEMGSIESSTKVVSDSISRLSEKSEKIGTILETISTIAGQTNLLALNAAIEAARAGEHGRGFAVVAEEVRKLAEQSQTAVQEIGTIITEIQQDTKVAVEAAVVGLNDVQSGTQVVDKAGGTFSTILGHIKDLNGGIDEITAMMQTMLHSSGQVVGEVKKITEASRHVAEQAENVSAASEEQSASMQEISSASKSLAQLAEELDKGVHKFKV
jgi:methyl-accepting chemotaxis protein